MAVLVWRHGTTAAAARAAIEAELARRGLADKVAWAGDELTASVGWGVVLSAAGRVTADAVVVDRVGGAAAGPALDKCRQFLGRLFPGGGPG